ncbi:hypothetical protein E2L08_13050 [Palleronia sediminis]|uniref:DUF2238 domain-containing protein n=1 Tax=Palleronia sediminis TaxID=2547833 RepID=A0A4V3B930_9RHOB|nr:hypothetical protein [Palleronia sediminis]TDL77709.1 hypothetical protein E2L08_13050 [Palleronia sediminis]
MHRSRRPIYPIALALGAMGLAAALLAVPFPKLGLALVCAGFGLSMILFEAVSGLRFPRRLIVIVTGFAAATLLLGEALQTYEELPWWDIALHGSAGTVLAAVGMALALLPTAGATPRTGLWILSVLAFGFAMMVGAMWEVLEFTLDTLFGTNAQAGGNSDTMTDTLANLAGALWGTLAAHLAVGTGRVWPPAGMLRDFIARNPVIYGAWRGPLDARASDPARQGHVGGREA